MFVFEKPHPKRFKRSVLIPILLLGGLFAIQCGSYTLPVDIDGDGFSLEQGDCNGEDANTFPGAPERCDGLDNNCDGVSDADRDHDGFLACSGCPTGVQCGDCNDDNEDIHPNAVEICDAYNIDEDCNGLINDNDPNVIGTAPVYPDDDGDGYGSQAISIQVCALPEVGYVALSGDCDDADPSIYPGAPEICEGTIKDSNCDGILPSLGVDVDEDGWGVCTAEGADLLPEDCNDSDASIHPNAPEICDGLDNDCNGLKDDPATDFDRDGDSTSDCLDDDLDGFTEEFGDCDDLDRHTHPRAEEYADGQDNDCDGRIDEELNNTDEDGDGFSRAQGDCDDSEARVNPLAVEICDEIDNDCDGEIDENVNSFWFADRDGDGYGGDVMSPTCTAPTPYASETGGDCDDGNPQINPAAPEICDDLDNDCDDAIDDWPDQPVWYYLDADNDGYGSTNQAIPSGCDAPLGYVSVDGDCNDADASVNPGIELDCADGEDRDCDGLSADGCAAEESLCLRTGGDWILGCVPKTCANPCGDDCTQCVTEAPICQCPEAANLWDGTLGCVSEDTCEGVDEPTDDIDGDGFPSGMDCNDEDPAINPGASEICRNGIDDNCNGAVDEDPCRAS